MGEAPPKLAPRKEGDPTAGIFWPSDGPPVELHSGYDGPAASMQGNPGFDRWTLSHVEGHAAALMRQSGLTDGTLEINNSKICKNCRDLLPKMLPSGGTLRIILPDGSSEVFKGVGP
jgi:hypothetical protein